MNSGEYKASPKKSVRVLLDQKDGSTNVISLRQKRGSKTHRKSVDNEFTSITDLDRLLNSIKRTNVLKVN